MIETNTTTRTTAQRILDVLYWMARIFIVLPFKWFIVMPIAVTALLLLGFIEAIWDFLVFVTFVIGVLTIFVFGLGFVFIIIAAIGLIVSMMLWSLTTLTIQLIGWIYREM